MLSRYSDTIRAGRSGDRNPVGGRDLPHSSRPGLGTTQPPIQWVLGLSRGKAAAAWRWPPTPSSADVKERVELYIYSPSGSSWLVQGLTLPLLYLYIVPVLPTRRTWYYGHLGPAQLQEESQTTLPLRNDTTMSMTRIIQVDLNLGNIPVTNQRWGREEPSGSLSNDCPPRSAIHVARVHCWQSRVLHSIRSHLITFNTAVGEVCVLSCSTCIYREWTPLAYSMWATQPAQI